MSEAKNIPQIKQLQGGVLVPYNVQQVMHTDEDGTQETFYKFDQIRLDQQVIPSFSEVAKYIWRQLQNDLHNHIYTYYDQGSQNTVQICARRAEKQGLTSIVDACEAIMNWIDSCLNYYYTKKTVLFSATDEQSLITVNWDFATNNPKPDTLKSLSEVRAMFG